MKKVIRFCFFIFLMLVVILGCQQQDNKLDLIEEVKEKNLKRDINKNNIIVENYEYINFSSSNLKNTQEVKKDISKEKDEIDVNNEDQSDLIDISQAKPSLPISQGIKKLKESIEEPKGEPKEKQKTDKDKVKEKKEEILIYEIEKMKSIPFEIIEIKDGTLEKGKEIIDIEGEEGEAQITYEITLVNGKETERKEVNHVVIKEATNQVIYIGTFEEVFQGKDFPVEYGYHFQEVMEERMLRLLNEYREENGLDKLELREDLIGTARYKSLSMLQLNYFDHINPNFSNKSIGHLIGSVFKLSHYSVVGENITATYGHSFYPATNMINKSFNNFLNSEGHNRNMLKPYWKYVGIGVVYATECGDNFGEGNALIVTQHFAY